MPCPYEAEEEFPMQLVWKCLACGQIHPVEAPPDRCPCGAAKTELVHVEED